MRKARIWVGAATLSAFSLSALVVNAGIEQGDVAVGKAKYTENCAICHGPKGDGQGDAGKALQPPPRDFTKGDFKFGGTDKDLYDIMVNGAASRGGSPNMGPFGLPLSEKERWSVVKYIRSLKTGGAAAKPDAKAKPEAKPKK